MEESFQSHFSMSEEGRRFKDIKNDEEMLNYPLKSTKRSKIHEIQGIES